MPFVRFAYRESLQKTNAGRNTAARVSGAFGRGSGRPRPLPRVAISEGLALAAFLLTCFLMIVCLSRRTEADDVPFRLETGGHTGEVRGLAFISPAGGQDSERLVSAGVDQTMRVWSPETNIMRLTAGKPRCVAFRYDSDDSGKGQILSAAYDAKRRRIALGCKAHKTGDPKMDVAEILIVDPQGNILKSLRDECRVGIHALAFSPGGDYLAVCDEYKQVFLYQTASWKSKQIGNFPGGSLAFSPEGDFLAIGGEKNVIHFWNLRAKKFSKSFLPPPPGQKEAAVTNSDVGSLAWSRDGYLAAGNSNGCVYGREQGAKDFALLQPPYDYGINCLAFDPAGKHLAVGLSGKLPHPGQVEILTVANSSRFRAPLEARNPVTSLAFSDGGETLASGDAAGEIRLWDWQKTRDGRNPQDLVGTGRSIYYLRWTNDGSVAAWSGDGASPQPSIAFNLANMQPSSLPDEKELAAQNKELTITGESRETATLSGKDGFKIESKDGYPFQYGIYDESKQRAYVAVGVLTPVIEEYDVQDRKHPPKLQRVFGGFSGQVNTLSVSPGSKYLAVGTADQVVRLWSLTDSDHDANVPQGIRPLINLFVGQDQEWIAWNQETKFYTASTYGEEIINYQFNDPANQKHAEVVPVSTCRSDYYDPACMVALFRSATMQTVWDRKDKLPTKATLQQMIQLRPIIDPDKILVRNVLATDGKVDIEEGVWDTDKDVILVDTANAIQASATLGRIKIEIRSVYSGSGRSIRGKYAKGDTPASGVLPDNAKRVYNGMNTLYVVARSEDGKISSLPCPVRVRCHSAKVNTGVLHILAIGVSHYAPNITSLKYAHEDAKAIRDFFATQKELYADVDPVLLTEGEATRAGIRKALETLKARVKPDDTIVFFIAGHGLDPKNVPDTEKNPDYYFAPSDYLLDNMDTAVSWKYIIAKLTEAQARQVFLFVDHCYAGGVTNALAVKSLSQSLNASGFVTFMASDANEESREHNDWKHGAFTLALLEALNGKGYDLSDPKSGTVNVRDIERAIKIKVRTLLSNVAEFRGSTQTPKLFAERSLSSELLDLPIAKIPSK